MNCATCKHWTPFVEEDRRDKEIAALEACIVDDAAMGYSTSWHKRELIKLRRRMGLCERTCNETERVDEATLAIAEDLSNRAILRTAPEFGCVQWEGKR